MLKYCCHRFQKFQKLFCFSFGGHFEKKCFGYWFQFAKNDAKYHFLAFFCEKIVERISLKDKLMTTGNYK